MNKITNILNQWSRGKLTLSGKITIVKSSALSKFVHLFISLPDQPSELLKELEKRFYKFIWNKGPDRISRRVLIKNVSSGGLRMIHIPNFVIALKSSWFRRVLMQSNNSSWLELSKVEFPKLLSVGGQYAESLSNHLANPFWTDLLSHWTFSVKKLTLSL